MCDFVIHGPGITDDLEDTFPKAMQSEFGH